MYISNRFSIRPGEEGLNITEIYCITQISLAFRDYKHISTSHFQKEKKNQTCVINAAAWSEVLKVSVCARAFQDNLVVLIDTARTFLPVNMVLYWILKELHNGLHKLSLSLSLSLSDCLFWKNMSTTCIFRVLSLSLSHTFLI